MLLNTGNPSPGPHQDLTRTANSCLRHQPQKQPRSAERRSLLRSAAQSLNGVADICAEQPSCHERPCAVARAAA